MDNYFFDTEEITKSKKLYILIIYDIVDNKKRVKFAKMLEGYGTRVQKSAFEAMISEKLYRQLLKQIPKMIDKAYDSVRVYKIIGQGEVHLFGLDRSIEAEDVIII